jgi:1-acyl-sn-glycerol-3-phosphate acyltransferase
MTKKTEENNHTYDNGIHPKEYKIADNYVFYPKSKWNHFIGFLIMFATRIALFLPKILFWGYKVKNIKIYRKNKSGSIFICNHAFFMDAFLISSSLLRKTIYVTSLQSNMGFGLFSKYIRICGTVPIPENVNLMRKFLRESMEVINMGRNILVFPEASLKPFCDHIRPFMPGAFHIANSTKANIIPMCITFHKPKGLMKIYRKKPCVHLNFLEPYKILALENRAETLEKASTEVQKIISDYFIENSDFFK